MLNLEYITFSSCLNNKVMHENNIEKEDGFMTRNKKSNKKESILESVIIEQLACAEINNLILQPPYHLVSNVQFNDRGISYDGSIIVYNDKRLEKSNSIGEVRIQVKGKTSTNKRKIKNDKIKYSVSKADLEVYYNNGNGILYFVVMINPNETVRKQAYYRILAPLELKKLLNELDRTGNKTISLAFKKIEEGQLERVCKEVIKVVEKQPKYYIEEAVNKDIVSYDLEYIADADGSFDVFEETVYIYGLTPDNTRYPIEAVNIEVIKKAYTETISIDDEELTVDFKMTFTKKENQIIIEDTIFMNIDNVKGTGTFHLGRLRTLDSYMKSLKVLQYYSRFNKLPFKTFQVGGIIESQNFYDINVKIKYYEELMDVCNKIGINKSFVFNENEDLTTLFNGIMNVFKNEQYELLNIHNEQILENMRIYNVNLSAYIKLRFICVDEKLINFFSSEALNKIGGLYPKNAIDDTPEENSSSSSLNDWEEKYIRGSIYMPFSIKEMIRYDNFNFEVLKLSFSDKYHDIKLPFTITTSLKYITHYVEFKDEKYLELARYLNERHLEEFPEDDIPKINIYLIKLIKGDQLLEEEKEDIYDIQDRAERENDLKINFACEVLLENKMKAKRVFGSLDENVKEEMIGYPIHQFYKTL